MEMSNLTSKLKDNENLHLVLVSLPAQLTQFKISYNTQKDKLSINEFISPCVQEEYRIKRASTESAHSATNRIKRARTESAHLATNFHGKKKRKPYECCRRDISTE